MCRGMINVDKFIDDLCRLVVRRVPFAHQGRDPNIGVDCIGLLRWGYLQQQPALPEELERGFDAYLRRPDGKVLLSTMRTWFDEADRADRRRGNLLVIYDRTNPQHVAVMINESEVVEAYSSKVSSVERVLRQKLDPRRIVAAVFRFPESGAKADKWRN